jgi:hypothetical protein
MTHLDFSCALKVLKLGKPIQRDSHKDVFYYLKDAIVYIRRMNDTIDNHIDDTIALFTSEEVLATDWTVVDTPSQI